MSNIEYRINVGSDAHSIDKSILDFRADNVEINVDTQQITVDNEQIIF